MKGHGQGDEHQGMTTSRTSSSLLDVNDDHHLRTAVNVGPYECMYACMREDDSACLDTNEYHAPSFSLSVRVLTPLMSMYVSG